LSEAGKIGDALGIRWESFTVAPFLLGLNVELEHGSCNPATDVTHDDPILTGKLVLAHLNDFPDYYTRLAYMMLGSGPREGMFENEPAFSKPLSRSGTSVHMEK